MSSVEENVVKEGKEESHGVKRPVEEVHSVNNWEAANLGDDERKQKFLRLMGASKKEHHGKFIIGDQAEKPKHTDATEHAEEISHALEDQYLHSLEMKLSGASRRHTGLGFQEPEEDDKEKEESESKEETENGDSSNSSSHEGSDSKDSHKSDEKEDSQTQTGENETEETDQEKNEEKKSYMAGFVKSSS